VGRRRRVRRKEPPKRPTIYKKYYNCPKCGALTLTVDLKKSKEYGKRVAIVKCGSCGLYCEYTVSSEVEKIDVYNMVADLVYEGRESECMEARGGEGEAAEEIVGE